MITNKNIIIIGFMGSGKSIISKELSSNLNRELFSTDELIEKSEKRSIQEIFESEGEEYFRTIEAQIVANVAQKKDVIIDCGGGVVLDPKNILRLRQNGIMIHLKASPETIYERVKDQKTRPLLNVGKPLDRIKLLMNEREEIYAQADFVVDTDNKTAEQVLDEIKEIIENDRN